MKIFAALALVALAGCGGAGGSSSITPAPTPFASLPPAFPATIALVQSNGNPAANTTLYAQVANCTAGAAFCQTAIALNASGVAQFLVVPTETYCFSTSGYIAPSQALSPPQYVTITAGGLDYDLLPACVAISTQTTSYDFAE